MNESRQRVLLEGQSSTARKLFNMVPIQEAWTESDISRASYASGSVRLGLNTVRACLMDLKESGLIKETQRGRFQRAPVTMKEATPALTIIKNSEPAMTTAAPTPAVAPLDLLGAVATELTLLSSEFAARAKALAARVEEVALSIEAQREQDAASMAKANKLQALLKEVMS